MKQQASPLSDVYYSPSNIDYVQRAIIDSVRSNTGYTIGRQDDGDLYNLMRKVYTDYMVNDSTDVPTQVSRMNRVVVSEATRTISNGILQNLIYLRDISTRPIPPDAPRSTSTYGLKLSRRI
jgi:hypothetical protein